MGPNISLKLLGYEAQRLGITQLFAYGELSRLAVAAFGQQAQHFSEQQQLIAALKLQLNAQTTALIKGSRSMQNGKIVAALEGEA